MKLNPNKTEVLWVNGSQIWELGALSILDGTAFSLK